MEKIKAYILIFCTCLVAACGTSSDGADSNNGGDVDGVDLISNEAPLVYIDKTITEVESGQQILLYATSQDTDGQITSYQWLSSGCSGAKWLSAQTDKPFFTAPNVDVETQCVITVVVTDNDGATKSDSFTLIVNPIQLTGNVQPSVKIETLITSIESEQTVKNLSATASDTDGTIVSYMWSSPNCNGASWQFVNSSTPWFTAPTVQTQTQCIISIQVTDDDGATASDSFTITITPILANDLLSRTWATIKTDIDPNNSKISPSASIAENGDVIGAWFVKYADRNGIEAGFLKSDESIWDLQGEISESTETAQLHYQSVKLTVETASNGYAVAVWASKNIEDQSNSIWVSISFGDGMWLKPTKIASDTSINDIHVDINNNGNVALTWTNASNEIYASVLSSSGELEVPIKKVGKFQIYKATRNSQILYYTKGVSVAIDENDIVQVIAVSKNLEPVTDGLYRYQYSSAEGWSNPQLLSTEDEPISVIDIDMGGSSNGNMFVVWQQPGKYGFDDVVGRTFTTGEGWSSILPLESRNDASYFNPRIDINDSGEAILALGYKGPGDGGLTDTYLTRRDISGNWSELLKINTYGHNWVDVAIDKSGHSILIMEDLGYVNAGILTNAGSWKGLKFIGYSGSYNGIFDQRLRMLPDGRAVVTWAGRENSGYAMLK